jgi:hypothetical protein
VRVPWLQNRHTGSVLMMVDVVAQARLGMIAEAIDQLRFSLSLIV